MPNDFTPYNPEWWANGVLAILNETLVALPLFNRDYSEDFAQGGEIINVRRPNKLTSSRRAETSAIVPQALSATNIAVPLDQQIVAAFEINDLEKRRSIEDLVRVYLEPLAFTLAQHADAIILAQAARFLQDGKFVGAPADRVADTIVDANVAMDDNLAPEMGRHMLIAPATAGRLLKDTTLTKVNEAGSSRPLRNGDIGNLFGVDLFKTQQQPKRQLVTSATGVVTLTAKTPGAAIGATTFQTAAQSSTATAAGDWLLIGGVPYKVASVAGAGDPYTFTLTRALQRAITTSQTIYVLKGVPFNAGYTAGHKETMTLNQTGVEYMPAIGDWVEIKSKMYAVVRKPSASVIELDRPLEDTVTTLDKVQTVPQGAYSFMAMRDAMTVVLRNLAPVAPNRGVDSAIASYNNMGLRIQMGYNQTYQKEMVTADFLMGIQVLDYSLGMVVVN